MRVWPLITRLFLAGWVFTVMACAGASVRSLAPSPRSTKRASLALAQESSRPPASRTPRCWTYLLATNDDAFLARLAMIDAARDSIDVQYYLFHDDMTGRILMERLIRAADRGVRVRLLVDDFGLVRFDGRLKRLDAHPQIEARVFNPFRQRTNFLGVSRTVELLADPQRLTRRMHNKLFAIDGRLAIIGGRNVGDAYFTTRPEAYFKDIDLLVDGAAAVEGRTMFDKFWHSEWAVPVRRLRGRVSEERARSELRAWQVATRQDQATHLAEDALATSPWPGRIRRPGGAGWTRSPVELVYDRPEKIDPATELGPERRLRPRLAECAAGCRDELLILSAYFVPSAEDVAFLRQLRERGTRVAVLTNSLAATDVPAVHGGYARWREALLRAGVELYELKPNANLGPRWQVKRRGSSRTSMHAKAFVFDRREVFIGSFNADPRSAALNTEMGVLADGPALAAQVRELFAEASRPAASYRLALNDSDQLVWHGTEQGRPIALHREPNASLWRHLIAMLTSLLPVGDQL